jgi:ABC-type branched-subunit amino acid transport system substrate-binding protein
VVGKRVVSAVLLLCGLLSGTACDRLRDASSGGPLIVVSAPLAAQAWIGRSVARGAELAVAQQRTVRGVASGPLRLQILDNDGSPSTAVANARTAVRRHAAALITDGTGALAVSQVTDAASLPVFVVFQGGGSFIDPVAHPTVFRLAPANRFMSRRLADYLAARQRSDIALMSDDSSYGRDGASQLGADLAQDGLSVVKRVVVPATAGDVSAQVLAARRAGARTLVLWAGAPTIAQVIRAARSAGWKVPLYLSPTGEDPLVRQQLADHPDWLDGATFVSFRITSEQGPAPFERFRAAYERRYGADRVGVLAGGRPVLQPPDWAMYSYDAVALISAALTITAGATGAPLLAAVESASVTGANGDQRGFGPDDREGVSSSDMYFGRFAKMRFAAVTDDALSTQLPAVAQ